MKTRSYQVGIFKLHLTKEQEQHLKNDDQFISFLTQHNEKINNIEILDEANLPATEKSVISS